MSKHAAVIAARDHHQHNDTVSSPTCACDSNGAVLAGSSPSCTANGPSCCIPALSAHRCHICVQHFWCGTKGEGEEAL